MMNSLKILVFEATIQNPGRPWWLTVYCQVSKEVPISSASWLGQNITILTCFPCAPWSVEGWFQGCQFVFFWHGTCYSCCMFLLSEKLYSSVKYFKNIYRIIFKSETIMTRSAADAYTVWHGHNESAHHKATWAQLTCTGVGGRTCLGIRAAGSKSAFLDSSGQLLDLLGCHETSSWHCFVSRTVF